MPTYLIADVTPQKSTTKTIIAENDAAAVRRGQEYLRFQTTSDAVTQFVCEGEKRTLTVGEVRRADVQLKEVSPSMVNGGMKTAVSQSSMIGGISFRSSLRSNSRDLRNPPNRLTSVLSDD